MADGKITITLKGGAGYDAPWVVIGGDSVPEVQEILKNAAALGLYGDVAAAAQFLQAAGGVPTSGGAAIYAGGGAVSGVAGAAAATPASTAPGNGGKFCSHGPRVRRSGTSARGAWVGHFCSLPKDHPDRCKPEYED